MVYLNLPSKLTEQEQELKRKFAQLKKIVSFMLWFVYLPSFMLNVIQV